MNKCLLALLFVVFSPVLHAQPFENLWHTPSDTTKVPGGVSMRNPIFPGIDATATFYQGVWKGEGANQTGGTFHYRIDGGNWQSQALGFHVNVNSDQYWKADLVMPATPGVQVEYYFFATLDNRTNTYLHAGQDGENAKTTTESVAQADPYSFIVGTSSSSGNASLSVNGSDANYNTLNFYIDENADTSFPGLSLVFSPGMPGLTEVEIFTNLNNRDRAHLDHNQDGYEDGIIPPDGNTIAVSDTAAYFQAHTMTDAGGGTYSLNLPVNKTGAYRLTARFKTTGDPDWKWIRDQGIRDLAVVVAPRIARDMNMYELHVTNANAEGPTFAQRGTFEDLHDPGARINLDWLDALGMNWIWFQPFHPQGIDGRQTDPATSQAYDPGSPYSIRNFWEINPLYSREYDGSLSNPASNPTNYAAAMQAFQDFADASDTAGIYLMLDFPFNHTAPDVVLGDMGIELFAPVGHDWLPGDLFRDRAPQFFSTNGGEGSPAYSSPAQSAAGAAAAPDRNDFGKWSDVRDVYFGNYSTLVTGYPDEETSRQVTRNEEDFMFYDSMVPETINVWRYFGEVLPYWIQQSGHSGANSAPSDGDAATRNTLDSLGIDGLRKDFGQGLPPQCMEYIINRTHSIKWNFVFMSESLDGQQVTYRSSRHFAVLNENIVFPLLEATETSGYRSIFESRRDAYGQSLVLLNNLSHDERPYDDPWQALIRYATVSTNDGSPMIMYGQEIGAASYNETTGLGSWDHYEENFGKRIPHFKKWNSMQPQWNAWQTNEVGVQFLFPVYSGIGQARLFSPALRSSNRWFLNQYVNDEANQNIFSVAKWTSSGVSAAHQDVVLAFTNLDRNQSRSDNFRIPSTLADLLGLNAGRTYNVRNIAAYLGRTNEHPGRRNAWLWGAGFTRNQIVNNGVFVALNPVPDSDALWATNPYEAQFLKVFDVTPPPAPGQPANALNQPYVIGSEVTFTWSENLGPDDNLSDYLISVGTTPGGSDVLSSTSTAGQTSFTATAAHGQTLYATVTPVSIAGVSGATSNVSAPVILLDPDGDEDGDGRSNRDEDIAGTRPLDSTSLFKITSIDRAVSTVTLTWNTQPGRTYTVDRNESLLSTAWLQIGTDLVTGTFLDTDPDAGTNFYRVRVRRTAP